MGSHNGVEPLPNRVVLSTKSQVTRGSLIVTNIFRTYRTLRTLSRCAFTIFAWLTMSKIQVNLCTFTRQNRFGMVWLLAPSCLSCLFCPSCLSYRSCPFSSEQVSQFAVFGTHANLCIVKKNALLHRKGLPMFIAFGEMGQQFTLRKRNGYQFNTFLVGGFNPFEKY